MMRKSARSGNRDVVRLEDIPNVGPSIAADLRQLGITAPDDLRSSDPYALYDALGRLSGRPHDPCVLNTFISAVRFMQGEAKKPWWKYTAERKRILAARSGLRG
jgi:hypothetical protein